MEQARQSLEYREAGRDTLKAIFLKDMRKKLAILQGERICLWHGRRARRIEIVPHLRRGKLLDAELEHEEDIGTVPVRFKELIDLYMCYMYLDLYFCSYRLLLELSSSTHGETWTVVGQRSIT